MLENLAGNRSESNPLGLVVNLLISFFVMGLKLSWSIVTLFVIPAMVYKDLGPFEAIKDSTQTLKKPGAKAWYAVTVWGSSSFCF